MNAIAPLAFAGSPLIARGVCKSFLSGQLRTTILDDISLSLDAGQLTLIAGPSGCGKSTLLAILSGLLRVDSGEVIALGEDLGRLDSKALERFRLHHTGFVFQEFGLFPALTAQEQVELPAFLANRFGSAYQQSRQVESIG